MDFTSSNSYVTDAGTGQRMHQQAQSVPTAVSDTDMNGLIWELLAAIKAGGLVPAAFDKTVPGTYTQLRDAIAIAVRLQSAAYAVAGGTADALTGTYAPVVPALVNGLTLYVRAATANATPTPTFSPNGLAPKAIVKGNGLPLVAGDIAGAGHWIELQYDSVLDKWVLLNPAFGIRAVSVQSLLSSNGIRSFPAYPGDTTPLIFQWVQGVTVASGRATGSWPFTFPNGVLREFVTVQGITGVSTLNASAGNGFSQTTYDAWSNTALAGTGLHILGIGF